LSLFHFARFDHRLGLAHRQTIRANTSPGKSNPPRKFGKSMHQQRSFPTGAPQLNLVPQCSQISFSIKNSNQDGQENSIRQFKH
jgi:hypothetical protein